jgi:hypothetical protein
MKYLKELVIIICIINRITAKITITPSNEDIVRYAGENFIATCEINQLITTQDQTSEIDPPLWMLPIKDKAKNTTQQIIEIYNHNNVVGSVLTLTNLTEKDEGTYWCASTTEDHEPVPTSDNQKFNLHIYRPIIFNNQPTQHLVSGTNDYITCNVTGKPKPMITWYVGTIQITEHFIPKYRYSLDRSTLHISSVTTADSGLYKCKAQQSTKYFGTFSESSLEVQVKYGPEWIFYPPTRIMARKGDNIVLTCKVNSEPKSAVEWTKMGPSNEINWQIEEGYNSQTLILTIREDLDYGVYLCTAGNEISSRQRLVYIYANPVDSVQQEKIGNEGTNVTPCVGLLIGLIIHCLGKGKTVPLLITILPLMMQNANAIIGFHCTNSRVNFTAISLTEVGNCPDITPTLKVTPAKLQVIQRKSFDLAPYYSCKIQVSLLVSHCGMFGHSSMVRNGLKNYIEPISETECKKIGEFGIYQPRQGMTISGITPNVSYAATITLAGKLSGGSDCSGESFSIGSDSYSDVTVLASYQILYKNGLALVEFDSNKVHLPSGTVCEPDKPCMDMEYGYSFIDLSHMTRACDADAYDIIYTGIVDLIENENVSHGQPRRIITGTAQNDVIFALELLRPTVICNQPGFLTEHPKIIVLKPGINNEFYFEKKTPIIAENVDLMTFINSKFVYLEKHLAGQLQSLYVTFAKQQCKRQVDILNNLLTIALIDESSFAYAYMKQPGFLSIRRGEVLYLAACTPVPVEIRSTERCYQELPVNFEGKPMFLTSRSRLLTSIGTETDCSIFVPSVFYLGDTYYAMFPKPIPIAQPAILSPQTNLSWAYKSPANLAKLGIYSYNELQNFQRRLIFPVELNAIQNAVVRSFIGQDAEIKKGSVLNLLTEGEVDKLSRSVANKLWSFVTILGTTFSGFFAIYIIIRVALFLADAILNSFALYRTFGFSIRLLTCIWTNLSRVLIETAIPKENVQVGTKVENNYEKVEMLNPTAPAVLYPNLENSHAV